MNITSIKIKELKTKQDIYDILVLFDNTFPRPISERVNLSEYAGKLFENAIVKVLLAEKETVGFIAYYCNDLDSRVAYLTQLSVEKKRKGFGKILLDDCVRNCVEKKMNTIMCEVDKDNDKAISFYNKNGFLLSSIASRESLYLIKKLCL